jgi:glycosyltransferase involved in cell wall biosynthesis
MLRVAIITNSLTGGGAERAMNTLARELSKSSDFRVALIPINFGPMDLIDPQCEIYPVNRTWRGSFLNTLLAFFRFQIILFKFKPKVVLLNCDLPEFFYSLTVSRARVFVIDHSTKSWKNHPTLGKLVWSLLRWRTAAVVRVSNRIPTRRPRPKHEQTILNPLPQEIWLLKNSEIKSPEFRLVFVGRISEEKDPLMFCEIASLTDTAAVMIGDGRLKSSLQVRFPHFLWIGQVTNPWSLISNRDLVLMTSLFEGDGLVLLEALANNLPVLVRDTKDFRSFGLPEINYFTTVDEAINKVEKFRNGAISLFLQPDFTNSILKARDPETLATQWSTVIFRNS